MSIIKTPITIAITVVLLAIIGYAGWSYWNDESVPVRTLNPFEYHLVQNSCAHFSRELEKEGELYNLVILPVQGHRRRNIPIQLINYLVANTKIDAKSMDEVEGQVRARKKEIKKEEEKISFDEEKYLRDLYTKKEGWGVLKLVVKNFKPGDKGKGATLKVEAHLQYRTEEEKIRDVVLPTFEQSIQSKFSFIYFSSWMKSHSPWWRLVFWLVFVIFLPLATTGLIVKIAGRQSNKYSFLMIMGYTGVDLFLAFMLVGFIVYSTWTGILLFLGFVISAIYNYELCDVVDDWN